MPPVFLRAAEGGEAGITPLAAASGSPDQPPCRIRWRTSAYWTYLNATSPRAASATRASESSAGTDVATGTSATSPLRVAVRCGLAQLAADGMSNKEIAQTLFVTIKTVEVHLSHCYRKLEISSRPQLDKALLKPAQSPPPAPA